MELLIPLPPANPQLEKALALVGEETNGFAADPLWQSVLLAPPAVRGVKRVTPVAVELSVLLTTHAGDQWQAWRADRMQASDQPPGPSPANHRLSSGRLSPITLEKQPSIRSTTSPPRPSRAKPPAHWRGSPVAT